MRSAEPNVRHARARAAARRFGLTLDARRDADRRDGPEQRRAIRALSALAPGSVALVAGPSGAGKSVLLERIGRAARASGRRLIVVRAGRLPDLPLVEALADALGFRAGEGAAHAMRWLVRAGLGEGALMVRCASRLSEGERARLRLALAFARAQRARRAPARAGGAPIVVVDEFLAALDRPCARSVAAGAAALARESGAALLVATSHDDLSRALAPTIEARLTLAGALSLRSRGAPSPIAGAPHAKRLPGALRLRIAPGSYEDYRALAPLHYRAGRPATIVRVLTAAAPGIDGPAGVLVVSMPTLRGAWRELAWPGRYRTWQGADARRAATERLNAEVRCISRVIVDPRCRSMGVATRLVRAYLRSALTVHTEAVGAMGAVASFFAAAGMTPYRLPARASDARLLDALAHCGVDEDLLATPRSAWARIGRADRRLLLRELRRWAGSSGVTRGRRRAPGRAIFDLASRRLRSETMAFAAPRR